MEGSGTVDKVPSLVPRSCSFDHKSVILTKIVKIRCLGFKQ